MKNLKLLMVLLLFTLAAPVQLVCADPILIYDANSQLLIGIDGLTMADPVNYVEDGTGLVPNNEWVDLEIYEFLGGISLETGIYDLSFSLEGTVWSEDSDGNPYGNWESNDELFIEIYFDGSLVAYTEDRQGGYGAVPFAMTLDFEIVGSGGQLSIIAWSDVSYEGEKWKVDTATLTGTSGTPVPEPATMLLLGTGLLGIAGLGRKRFKK